MRNTCKFEVVHPKEMEAFQNLVNDMCRRFNEIDEAEGYKEFEFLDIVERDLEAIKSTGLIKFAFVDKNHISENNEERKHRINQSKSSAIKSIKLERVSENLFESSSEMPPPQLPVKRVKKVPSVVTAKTEPMRHTRSKTTAKYKNAESVLGEPIQRDSDVILTKEHIAVIILDNSDDENESHYAKEEKNLRQIKKEKLSTSLSKSEDESEKNKAVESTMVLSSRQSSIYEDCLNVPQSIAGGDTTYICPATQNNNATFVQHTQDNGTTKIQEQAIMNETIVLNKPIIVLPSTNNLNINDLMTDDESMQENRILKKCEVAKTVLVKKAKKPIFSPFESSPVKSRVAAFEKLKVEDTTVRITRTKTKNQAKQEKENIEQAMELNEPQLKLKPKITPQMTNRVLPLYASSTSKIMNHSSGLNSDFKLPVKAASALKASQQEFKEREIRRREKELENIRKKEELRQLQIEESKRKREERHLKAQQIREEQEKNKKKLLEQRRLKEEKYNQLLAEKQERRQKQQEENEKKRMQALKKAEERRQKEEEKLLRIEKESKVKNTTVKSQPIYMTQKAPLLPTDECYDSDEEQCTTAKVSRPSWQQGELMRMALFTQQYASTKPLYTFFCCESQTPDLRDIFENIDPKKLKRNSSAIWHKAPRFTMFPVGDTFNESDESEED